MCRSHVGITFFFNRFSPSSNLCIMQMKVSQFTQSVFTYIKQNYYRPSCFPTNGTLIISYLFGTVFASFIYLITSLCKATASQKYTIILNLKHDVHWRFLATMTPPFSWQTITTSPSPNIACISQHVSIHLRTVVMATCFHVAPPNGMHTHQDVWLTPSCTLSFGGCRRHTKICCR